MFKNKLFQTLLLFTVTSLMPAAFCKAGSYQKAATSYARRIGLDPSQEEVKSLILEASTLGDTLKIARYIEEKFPFISIKKKSDDMYKEGDYIFPHIEKMFVGATMHSIALIQFVDSSGIVFAGIERVIKAMNDPSSSYYAGATSSTVAKDAYEEGMIPYTFKAALGETRSTIYPELDNIKRKVIANMSLERKDTIKYIGIIHERVAKDLEYIACRLRYSTAPDKEFMDVPSYYLA